MTLLDSSCIPKAHHLKYIVGNEAQDQISKRLFQENEARQIFRKTYISYPHGHTFFKSQIIYL